ncbi:MAG: hypothetical protein WD871_01615 [Xanthobacteraceae bacterium]
MSSNTVRAEESFAAAASRARLSRQQAVMFGVLQRAADATPGRFVSGPDLARALGVKKVGDLRLYLGVKLQRVGIILESRGGAGGGFRLVTPRAGGAT